MILAQTASLDGIVCVLSADFSGARHGLQRPAPKGQAGGGLAL